MTTFEIILAVVVAILLIHHIWWGIRASNAVTQHRKAMLARHPDTTIPVDPTWPPDELKFP
jgi:hypothetical protein